jgi:GGDEF domain-containing protein
VEGDLNGNGAESPRPRRELIAEEMEAAQSNSEKLALALVHLNRAESIARRGEEAVASAEHLFEARLDQLMPAQRIERFGELTYGIFFREGADAVEPQVAELKARMAQEEGELEGGVSVGAAVWNEEDPEALRTEATEALREAYETGTPTIVT